MTNFLKRLHTLFPARLFNVLDIIGQFRGGTDGTAGNSYCGCSNPVFLDYSYQVLNWHSKAGDAYNKGRVACMVHEKLSDGTSKVRLPAKWHYYNVSDGYNKSFDTLEGLIEWAKQKGFTEAHIKAFLTRYREKKDQAEKDVAEGR